MSFFLCVSLSIYMTGCSEHAGDEKITTPSIQKTAASDADFNPDNLSYDQNDYEIVLMDDDKWYIMLNKRKERRISSSYDSLITYEGVLYYKLSYYHVTGYTSALYDERNQDLHVCCFDAAWNRGIINYNIYFTDPSGIGMKSAYYYHRFPHRMNGIDMSFLKGSIGEHIVPAGLAKVTLQEAKTDRKW